MKYPDIREFHEYKFLQQVEPTQLDLFYNVLADIKNVISPVMMELGCGDAVYSRLFYDNFNGQCTNINVEQRLEMVKIAKDVVPSATILHGVVGTELHIQESWPTHEEDKNARVIPITELFDIIDDKNVSILHMDLQGSEVSVLEEMVKNDLFKRVNYIFCSLHANHLACQHILEKLSGHNIRYLFQHPTEGGYGDGLIVCQILEKTYNKYE